MTPKITPNSTPKLTPNSTPKLTPNSTPDSTPCFTTCHIMGALREIETSQEKSETPFGGHAVLIKKL
jgi:hypothetical protein